MSAFLKVMAWFVGELYQEALCSSFDPLIIPPAQDDSKGQWHCDCNPEPPNTRNMNGLAGSD